MNGDWVGPADRPLADNIRVRHVPDHVALLDGSPQMRAIRTTIDNIADTDAMVLIRGESGVGKDLVARPIHAACRSRRGRFVEGQCGAHPSELPECEDYGHEEGAYAGAQRQTPGQLGPCHDDTIYVHD